jgi:phage regulator Rha-like protein
MNELQVIEYKGFVVATTKQIAEAYGASPKKVSNNFNANKKRYTEGKHYFMLDGEELRQFKDLSRNSGLVDRAPKLYLWTERGALLLAKSINTDTAWEAYERLVDFYFTKKNECTQQLQPVPEPQPAIEDFQTSNSIIPKNQNWFKRNYRKMEWICEHMNISLSQLYHRILVRVGEEYDIEYANLKYEQETGHPPKYAMDVVSYFPQLAELAEIYLECTEKEITNFVFK